MELRSDVCTVRDYRSTDATNLAAHGNNRKIWLQLRDRFPHPYTAQLAEQYIAVVTASPTPLSFAIDHDGEAIGGISLHAREDIERIGAEIGYWLGESFWGRGIASQAIRMLTRHALDALGLSRVFALPFTDNLASRRALEKAGYVCEGVLQQSAIKDGILHDQALYARVRR